MSGPLLLIFSAFLHALWNAFIKKSENKSVTLFYVIVIGTLFSICISPWTGGLQWGSSLAVQRMLMAGIFEAGYFFTLAKALEKAPLGLGYTVMRGGAMVFVWLISVLLLGELLNLQSVLAIALILFGIILTHSRGKHKTLTLEGFSWSLGAAFFIAGYHIFYGLALKEGASQVALFTGAMVVSFPVLIWQAGKGILDFKNNFLGSKKYYLIIAGVVSASSFILFLYGLISAGAGVAISLRNTSVAFAQVFAFFLGEKLSVKQWIAVSCIFVGTLFIT